MSRFCHLRSVFAVAILCAPAGAYYHYVHYTSPVAPFAPIVEKFDLTALPDKTVTFYVSSDGPAHYLPGDSFESVVAQVKEATRTWNAVPTSELRVAFGGLYTPGTPWLRPAGEVVFEEMPPGVLGLGGPTIRGDAISGPAGPFIPILRSTVHLNRDLTQRPGPSANEAFFLTTLHEMGHALGLQHTLASATMSTDVTRATSRAKPLDDDDIAGLSLLYPTGNFARLFGSISGRVTAGNQGMHLASVVAIRQGGSAISTLTNPDGTYRIDGVPPGHYMIYVHPLPPGTQNGLGDANIVLPFDVDNQTVEASGAFDTVFYPGTRDLAGAVPIGVTSSATTEGIDFSVNRRPYSPIYGVTTWSFYGQTPVKPGYLNVSPGVGTVVAYGAGLTSGSDVAPGLSVTTLDGTAVFSPNSFRAYGTPAFLAFDLLFNFLSGVGPRHLVFSNPDDIYVLPGGVQLVQKEPPAVDSVIPGAGEGIARPVLITGRNLTPATRFYFDGARATVRSLDTSTGEAILMPPPAPGGHQAVITAVNPDGQTSMFVQAQAPPVYAYDAAEPATVLLSPAALPAGSEGMVEITGFNTNFAAGQTVAGFGTPDVTVTRLFVIGPDRALANVAVASGATTGFSMVSVATGLQLTGVPYGFEVQAGDVRLPRVNSSLVDSATRQLRIYPGAVAWINGLNLAGSEGDIGTTVSLRPVSATDEIPLTVVAANANRVTVRIPADFPLGPAILRVNNGLMNALPLVVVIEQAPPVIVAVKNAHGETVDTTHPAQAGQPLTISLTGMGDIGGDIASSRIEVQVGGLTHPLLSGAWSAAAPGVYEVSVLLSSAVPAGEQVALTVSLDGRISRSFPIAVQE